MTKSEISDKFWLEYLVWCANMPDEGANVLFKWLRLNNPTEANFWTWFVEIKNDKCK